MAPMPDNNLPKLNLINQDATALVAALRNRKVTVRALAEACLDQIDAVNPQVNAIVSLRDRAEILTDADTMDAAGPGDDQQLWGLPAAIKDLQETKGLRTTYGSPVHAEFLPDADSLLAGRLRNAGMLIIGKTNTPEFGVGSHSYNPVHGVTRNPYDISRSAGGSSGGAGAALSARMVPLADGSDMMGSLRNPAAWNNVYGFRPSAGLVAKDSVGNIYNQALSTCGPMARSPRDMDMMLKVIGRPDPRLPTQLPAYPGMKDVNPAEITIGWVGDWKNYLPVEDGVLSVCESALDRLSGLGCKIIEFTPDIAPDKLWESWTTLRSYTIAGESARLCHDPETREQLKEALIWEIERGLSFSAQDIHRANVIRSDWFREVAMLKRIDLLALPSAQMFPFNAEIDYPRKVAGRAMDTYHRWMEVVVPAALIGLPAVSLPAGFADTGQASGLPMGIQLIGKFGTDTSLMGIAQKYHENTMWPQNNPPEHS